ncbi:hypothetical protein BKA66DRAFT_613930 [Pyrenochaeta sp. MPI-SDFR-AT-0127]|nr:hypothetical protein BKA66DRAFT_613930 [Pyrenochaeta sp. MPI-SDFR-AT-0127]
MQKACPTLGFSSSPKRTPKTPQSFKKKLEDEDTIESDFIGASEEDCQEWLLNEQDQVNFMEFDILFIADARSANEDTLLAKVYKRQQIVYGHGKKLPPRPYSWYEFNINFKEAWMLHSDVNFGPASAVDPVYYERKIEAVDENGLFSVVEADRLIYHPKN